MTGNAKIGKIAAVWSVIAVLAIIFSSTLAYAAELPGGGKLAIVAEYDKNALSGIDVEIFFIAKASIHDGVPEYAPAARFAEALEGEEYDPNGMMASENAALTEKLKEYISEKSLSGTALETNGAGEAAFENLEAGVYLVLQKPSSKANSLGYNMQSFVIPVPYPEQSGLLNYIVTAHPKTEPKKGTLKLTKVVSGGAGISTGFWFTVKFAYPEGSARDGVMLNGAKIEEELSLRLTAGETAEFTNIPFGTQYEITEVNIPEGYALVGITGGGKGSLEATAPLVEVTASNSRIPPPPPPTTSPTPPPPTTQQPATNPPPTLWPTTDPTVPPVRRPTSPQPTTQPAAQPETTAEIAEPATEPTIDTANEEYEEVDSSVPLGNIEFGDEEKEEEYEEENIRVPLGNIRFPSVEVLEEFEEIDEKVPLGNIEFGGGDGGPKENPKTGDGAIIALIGIGSMLFCAALSAVRKKKRNLK